MSKYLSVKFFKAGKFLLKKKLEKFKKELHLIAYNDKTNNFINALDVDLNCIKGEGIMIQEGSSIDSETIIGDYTFVGFNTRITKTVIGSYCSIANNVNIGDGEHPLNSISTSSIFFNNDIPELTKRPCKIGNDVWIGVGAIIRRGVTIGDGAVIGANSFVNKDVLPYAIVAGSPAKLIRKRFDDVKIERLLKSKWWELPLEEATRRIKELDQQL